MLVGLVAVVILNVVCGDVVVTVTPVVLVPPIQVEL